MLVAFLPLVLMLLWTSRSQQKKQKELESKLKKGDRVVTQSGLIGRLVEFGDARHVRVEIAPGVKVQMLRTAITGVEADPDTGSKGKEESAASDKKS
jgi:preprotein translocase subunit YajC